MCYHGARFTMDGPHAMTTRRKLLAPLINLLALSPMWLAGVIFAGPPVDFRNDIAPILEQHCIRCHQPANQKSGLSLATFAALEENGYVVSGDPDASYLLDVVTATAGQKPLMPKEGAPLSAQEISALREWIRAGARWP